MKKASRVLYLIGIIFNILSIIAMLICTIVFWATDISYLPEGKCDMTLTDYQQQMTTLRIASLISVIVLLIVLFIALWALKSLKNKKVENMPHILMIIIGVFGTSLFYILGGVFGIVAENQANKKSDSTK